MKVLIVVVGRAKGSLADAVEEYEGRARRFWKLEVVEVRAGVHGSGGARAEQVLAAEAQRILARLPPDIEVVALTRSGDGMSSVELAGYLEGLGTRSAPGVAFVIGGAFGLGEAVLERARKRLSLSTLTLPHEMARTVLSEQLYRAATIIRGEPYHKG